MTSEEEQIDKINYWLDVQTINEFDPRTMFSATEAAQILKIVAERIDYTYNGLIVQKKPVKTVLEIVDGYFADYKYPQYHESTFGCFRNFELRTFVENFLKCAKSKNKKIPIATKNEAIKTLARLRNYLSTNTATYTHGNTPLRPTSTARK